MVNWKKPVVVSREYLDDIMKEVELEGPFETFEVFRNSFVLNYGRSSCDRAAKYIAEKRGYDLVCREGEGILCAILDTVLIDYSFYRFA